MKKFVKVGSLLAAATIMFSCLSGNYIYADDDIDVEITDVEEDSEESEDIEVSDVDSFIRRLYTTVLGREYDINGLEHWKTEIFTSQVTINYVARSFITGDEFTGKDITDDEYIQILYGAFFNRTPGKTEVDYWINALNNGYSRDDVLEGFLGSREWAGLCENYGINNPDELYDGPVEVPQDVYNFVERLYTLILDRESDNQGCEYWAQEICTGRKSACEVAMGFIYSDEFQSREFDNTEYIQILYNVFLNRDAEPDGMEYWLYYLDHGTSPYFAIYGFSQSNEFTGICESYGITRGDLELVEIRDCAPDVTVIAFNIYSVLGRNPTTDDLNSTVANLLNECGARSVVNTIFSSEEYANRNRRDRGFAIDVYTGILGRRPSEEEITAIVDSLSEGTSRQSIIDSFVSSSEFAGICDNAGINVERRQVAPTYLSPALQADINARVHTLRDAFDYAAGLTYYRHTVDPAVGTRYLAERGFNSGVGNCYTMAAVFLEMAHNLGYEGVQIAGQVPSSRGGLTPHSWTEIIIDGEMYVCDPNFTNETGRNGYMIHYGQSGTWRYVPEQRMNP